MAKPPLRAEGVGRRYRRRGPWALRDVTLEFTRGSITALVGPNGAGKSTLIRSWMGFEHPNEGRVFVEGVDPRRDRVGAVSRIGQLAALQTAGFLVVALVVGLATIPVVDRRRPV